MSSACRRGKSRRANSGALLGPLSFQHCALNLEIKADDGSLTPRGRPRRRAEGARKRKELDNAGMAYRKTLDIGLKKFDATLKGTLYERIDALAARHDITTAMQEWVHQVRLIGNDANHEEHEPKEADIEAIASFTETLLEYLFTLPTEVKVRKQKSALPRG
jgi:hypothetical protein